MTARWPGGASTTFATWSYQLSFGNLLPAFGPGAAVGQHADRDDAHLRIVYFRIQRKAARIMTTQAHVVQDRNRLAADGLMLFPVYWMVNVSFTRDQDMRKIPPNWFPFHGTLAGYRAVLHQQGPYIATSIVIGFGTVALTLLLAAPAGYSLAQAATAWRWRAQFRAPHRADDPGNHHGDGVLRHLPELQGDQHTAGPHRRRLHARRSVRSADLYRIHVGDPRRTPPGGTNRRSRATSEASGPSSCRSAATRS